MTRGGKMGVLSQAVILGVIVNLIIVLGGIVDVGTLSVPLFLGVKHKCTIVESSSIAFRERSPLASGHIPTILRKTKKDSD